MMWSKIVHLNVRLLNIKIFFSRKLNKYLFFSIKAKNTLYLEYFRHANHLHIKSGTICATSLESNDSIEYNVDVVIS